MPARSGGFDRRVGFLKKHVDFDGFATIIAGPCRVRSPVRDRIVSTKRSFDMGIFNGILGIFGGFGAAIWLILGAAVLFFLNNSNNMAT